MKRNTKVYMWWSASDTYRVTFIKWIRMRMGTGREDTNKIGVGALVKSDWLFQPPLLNRRQRGGLKVGYYKVHPYHDLYRKDPLRYNPAGKIRRPNIKELHK